MCVQILRISCALSVIRTLRPVGSTAVTEEHKEINKKRDNTQEVILTQKPETQEEEEEEEEEEETTNIQEHFEKVE